MAATTAVRGMATGRDTAIRRAIIRAMVSTAAPGGGMEAVMGAATATAGDTAAAGMAAMVGMAAVTAIADRAMAPC